MVTLQSNTSKLTLLFIIYRYLNSEQIRLFKSRYKKRKNNKNLALNANTLPSPETGTNCSQSCACLRLSTTYTHILCTYVTTEILTFEIL